MVLFIGHSSAIRLLRSLEDFEGIRAARAMPSSKDVPSLPKSFRESSPLATLPRPLEVVVSLGKTRSQSKQFHNNIWKLPDRAPCFLFIESGVYLSNPEFCFVQLARSCSVIDLIKLGFELCGTYRIDPASLIGFRTAQPLSSTEAINRFIDKMHGKVPRKAKTAVRYVRNGSASPMETCLALLLGLPARYGGYGLGMPEMNAELLIPAKLGKQTTYREYHCDLYWPEQNVAIEYNSREFHVNELAVERDASRINNLKAAGIEALAVTRAHVADHMKFDAIAHSAASLMGKRIRIAYADIDERRMSLRKQLFSKDPWC